MSVMSLEQRASGSIRASFLLSR